MSYFPLTYDTLAHSADFAVNGVVLEITPIQIGLFIVLCVVIIFLIMDHIKFIANQRQYDNNYQIANSFIEKYKEIPLEFYQD